MLSWGHCLDLKLYKAGVGFTFWGPIGAVPPSISPSFLGDCGPACGDPLKIHSTQINH